MKIGQGRRKLKYQRGNFGGAFNFGPGGPDGFTGRTIEFKTEDGTRITVSMTDAEFNHVLARMLEFKADLGGAPGTVKIYGVD